MTNVTGGFHTLYVRTQDADGLWNVAPASVFYRLPDAIVDPLADITKMEYFIDKTRGLALEPIYRLHPPAMWQKILRSIFLQFRPDSIPCISVPEMPTAIGMS